MGLGPGNRGQMTLEALRALEESAVIIGYKVYVALIKEMVGEKEIHSTGMGREIERCLLAIEKALTGQTVALVSSGDSGIYGMAGLVYELLAGQFTGVELDVRVIPGISAANASAALLGAPLMNDWASISLSDALTPWEMIERRLHAAGEGDFVIALYNPKSRARPRNLEKAIEVLRNYRGVETLVGIATNAYREGERTKITTLGQLAEEDVDMFTTVIVGNSFTQEIDGFLVTVRGYPL